MVDAARGRDIGRAEQDGGDRAGPSVVNISVIGSAKKGMQGAPDSDDDDDDGSGVRLYQSIYETALRNKVPPAVIRERKCTLAAPGI